MDSALLDVNCCLAHIAKIKHALGISGIATEEASWQYHPQSPAERGDQIDLLIDRADNAINLCELKFSFVNNHVQLNQLF